MILKIKLSDVILDVSSLQISISSLPDCVIVKSAKVILLTKIVLFPISSYDKKDIDINKS